MLLDADNIPPSTPSLQSYTNDVYDDQGRLIFRTTYHDWGGRTEETWDINHTESYWVIRNEFDNVGAHFKQGIEWDNGEWTVFLYDPHSQFDWNYTEERFHPTGHHLWNKKFFDNGWREETIWDVYGFHDWWSIDRSFDQTGARRFERFVFDDGVRKVTNLSLIGIFAETSESIILGDGRLLSEKCQAESSTGIHFVYSKTWDLYNEHDWWYVETRKEPGTDIYQIGQRDTGDLWASAHDSVTELLLSVPLVETMSGRSAGSLSANDLLAVTFRDEQDDRNILNELSEKEGILDLSLSLQNSGCPAHWPNCDEEDPLAPGSQFGSNVATVIGAVGDALPALAVVLGQQGGPLVAAGTVLGGMGFAASAIVNTFNKPSVAEVAGGLAQSGSSVALGLTLPLFAAGGPWSLAFGIGLYATAPNAVGAVVTWVYNQMGWNGQPYHAPQDDPTSPFSTNFNLALENRRDMQIA